MEIRLWAILLDIIIILTAFSLSFSIRFPDHNYYQQIFRINLSSLPFLCLIYIVSLSATGTYKKRFRSYYPIIKKSALGLLIGFLANMSFIYIFRMKWSSFPSSIFLLSLSIFSFFLISIKLFLYKISGNIFNRVVFVGENELNDLSKIYNSDINEIVLTTKSPKVEHLYLLVSLTETRNIKLSILPELYDEIIAKKIRDKNISSFILPAYFENRPEESLIRFFDIFTSVWLLFFSCPVMILVAVLIKIDSNGPVIFKQKRVGLNGKEFILYKFRSMIEDAEEFSRPKEVPLEQDSRVTKIGKFLRRARLDELPQLFNVIKGDMSFVGPRPEAVYRVKEHRAFQGIRLSVRPGLTGLAQIEGYYHTIPSHKLKYDYLYIKNKSLNLNLKILLKTVLVILFRPGS